MSRTILNVWKCNLTVVQHLNSTIPLPLSILLNSRRQIHDRIIHTNRKIKSVNQWSKDLQIKLDVRTDKLFSIPFDINNDSNLQWFQFRINHRILGTNVLLEKMKIKDNKLCSYCNKDPETLLHLFLKCPQIIDFWKKLEQFIDSNCQDISFTISARNVIFGDTKANDALNTILILAKSYIFRNKEKGQPPHIEHFKKPISKYYHTEKCIALSNMTTDKFDKKWVPLLNLIRNWETR